MKKKIVKEKEVEKTSNPVMDDIQDRNPKLEDSIVQSNPTIEPYEEK